MNCMFEVIRRLLTKFGFQVLQFQVVLMFCTKIQLNFVSVIWPKLTNKIFGYIVFTITQVKRTLMIFKAFWSLNWHFFSTSQKLNSFFSVDFLTTRIWKILLFSLLCHSNVFESYKMSLRLCGSITVSLEMPSSSLWISSTEYWPSFSPADSDKFSMRNVAT